jgi:phosphoglycerol transferase
MEQPMRRMASEWWAVVPLLCLTGAAWCTANAKWTPAEWAVPASYTDDPEKSDVIITLAGMKAATEGDSLPFLWKTVGSLGAPHTGNWNDWPSLDEVHGLVQLVLAQTFGIFAGLNVLLLLGHLLAAASFYGVARWSGAAVPWSFVGGLAFGVAPFLFAQSAHHSTVQWAWHVPLFTLVWRWIVTDDGIEWRSSRFWTAVAIGLIAGLQNVYYTNIFCQLTLVGAVVRAIRLRTSRPLAVAAAVIGAAAFGFFVSNLDTWTYKLAHGGNEGALVREYKWIEIYGLKIKDLFIPPIAHRSDVLAHFSKAHRQVAPLNDEGASYQGIVGLSCLLWLVATSVRAMIDRREREVPLEAWQMLWIVLMFTTGGFNAIIGAFGFTMFRGACRYSIVILAITLLWAARRLSAMQTASEAAHPNVATKRLWTVAAAVTCLIILWDQVPRSPTVEETATIARLVDADREFTEKMETALPVGAMVFQLPVMEFPESPAAGVPPYDHFRPYLYSKNLHYSFGSMKGRERERWQPAVQAKFFEGAILDQNAGKIRVNENNARIAVDELKRLGFSAIYVNRNGFPDRGKGIEESLLDLGYAKPPIRNATGDLSCIVLEKQQEKK